MNPSPSPSPSSTPLTTLDYAAHISDQSDIALAVLIVLAVLVVLSLGVLLVRAI